MRWTEVVPETSVSFNQLACLIAGEDILFVVHFKMVLVTRIMQRRMI
jgi:hypothetical protein